MIKIVGVRFRNAGKVYYFNPNDLQVRIGEHVIAETSKGLEYGTISTCTKMVDEELVLQPLRSLVRKATEEDEEKMVSLRIKEKEALRVCREKVREHELDMKMVDAEYSFDASKVLFYFTADGRVDFRNLVKDLAAVFHVRIELRQIGVRDETRMLGGIGICGRELCCATYLREFQPVSIKMAKEQNLSLNPAKISGTCGRLMCCLKNEEATYEFLNAKMPKMGEEAVTADGMVGKVVELDVLRQRVRVLFEEDDTKEIETFPVADLTFRPRKKKDPSAQGKKNKAEKGESERKNGKNPEDRPENGKNPEDRPENGKNPEDRRGNGKDAEARIENGKNPEDRPERGKNTEDWPERGKNTEDRPERGKNAEGRPERGKNAEGRQDRGKSAEGKSEHGKNAGVKSQRGKNAGGKPQRSKGGDGRDDASEKNDRSGRQDRHEKQEHSERKHPRHKKQNRPDGNAGQNGRETAPGEAGGEENKGWSKKRRNRPKRQNSENHQGSAGENHPSSPAQERGGNNAE